MSCNASLILHGTAHFLDIANKTTTARRGSLRETVYDYGAAIIVKQILGGVRDTHI